jgi:hypothetical protein
MSKIPDPLPWRGITFERDRFEHTCHAWVGESTTPSGQPGLIRVKLQRLNGGRLWRADFCFCSRIFMGKGNSAPEALEASLATWIAQHRLELERLQAWKERT